MINADQNHKNKGYKLTATLCIYKNRKCKNNPPVPPVKFTLHGRSYCQEIGNKVLNLYLRNVPKYLLTSKIKKVLITYNPIHTTWITGSRTGFINSFL